MHSMSMPRPTMKEQNILFYLLKLGKIDSRGLYGTIQDSSRKVLEFDFVELNTLKSA